MTITMIDPNAAEIHIDGETFLAFPTGIKPRRFRNADTVALRKSMGAVIQKNGQFKPWPINRLLEHDGMMFALGPYLANSRPFASRALGPDVLAALIPAVRLLGEWGYPLSGLYEPALRWLPDGQLLLFPPQLADWVRELRPSHQIRGDWEPWVHPDLQGEAGWSFVFGVMTWRILAGNDPFAGETGENRRERIRGGVLPPLKIPGLNPAVGTMMQSALSLNSGSKPSIDDWEKLISLWQKEGAVSASGNEGGESRPVIDPKPHAAERRLRTQRWLRKSGWKLILSLAAAAAIAAVGLGPVREAFRAPLTVGMTPHQVAETYYAAINNLDSELMEDCLARKVGRDDRRHVDTVYVTHKVRQGYEGLGDFPAAAEWIAAGKPELPSGIWPWGITNLTLTQMGDGRLMARYQFWAPMGNAEANTPYGVRRQDVLSFTEGSRSWEISRIDRVTEEYERESKDPRP